MSKIFVVILFISIVLCTGLQREQEPRSNNKSESEEDADKYNLESRQDFDKTSEKEKELRFLRKAKKLKGNNYRRALESILPAKKSESYRRLFEDLIISSDEKSKLNDSPRKVVEEVVDADTLENDEGEEERSGDPQLEEIEVVIEHITDSDNDNVTNSKIDDPSESQDPSTNDSQTHADFLEKPNTHTTAENQDKEQLLKPLTIDENAKGRTGQDTSRNAEIGGALHLGQLAERRVLESYPVNRFSEVRIPHYRTTLTRNGVVVSPAVYTVQTSAPVIDHVTTRSWIPNRGILPDGYRRPNNIGRSDIDTKLIDDYNDYGANAYSYSPSKTFLPARHVDNKMEILSKLPEDSLQLGIKPLRENLYPSTYYAEPQTYYSDINRAFFRIHR